MDLLLYWLLGWLLYLLGRKGEILLRIVFENYGLRIIYVGLTLPWKQLASPFGLIVAYDL